MVDIKSLKSIKLIYKKFSYREKSVLKKKLKIQSHNLHKFMQEKIVIRTQFIFTCIYMIHGSQIQVF